MSLDETRIERMLGLTRRLTEALSADIDALDRGVPREMCTPLPETQQFVVAYAREAAAVKGQIAALAAPHRDLLKSATAALHKALAQHERRLTRVRNASEGMIRAIVEDVERRKRVTRTYSPKPVAKPSPAAMIFNGLA